MIKVWDPAVRLFHWSLVAAFATAWISAEESRPLHETAGYVVAGLLAFRLVWGLIGPRYARFAQFVKGPGSVLRYLGAAVTGTERRHIGHNPAGAAMIVAILLTLSGTAFTGWLMADRTRLALLPDLPAIVSPAYADSDEDEDEGEGGAYFGGAIEGGLEEAHEVLANLMLALVVLHVGGVILSSLRHRENLARAMVTGRKRAPGPDDVA